MKAIVLMLLIATAYCIPVKRSASSSESSEERVVAQKPGHMQRKAAAKLAQAEPTETTPVESSESTDSADDTEEADDESEADEKEEDNTTNSSESDSEETSATSGPPTEEPTLAPTIETGRGDNLVYSGDYKKTIVYVDAKEKVPKSYNSEKMGDLTMVSKKMSSYNGQYVNDVEKDNKLYKALELKNVLLENEYTSTPEMEAAPGDHELDPVANQDIEGANLGDSSSVSASASEETEDSISSSQETTATPGAADSDSSQSTESQESEEVVTQALTTEALVVIAK